MTAYRSLTTQEFDWGMPSGPKLMGVTVGGSLGLLNCLEDEDLCLSSEKLRGKEIRPRMPVV